MRCRARFALLCLIGMAPLFASAPANAQIPLEEIGKSETLQQPFGAHWVWLSDALLKRTALVDLDAERLLGMLDGGWGTTVALFPNRREIYVPETHYSRRSRGVRTDVVTFYDAKTLMPTGEVIIPPKRAMNPLPSANATLSDDDRFIAVFNMNPATSISIVDAVDQRFVGEISTPGCSVVYAAGARRFAMLCADGGLLLVEIDDEGNELRKTRSAPFFDPLADPILTKSARLGDTWYFVSYTGRVHEVDLSGAEPRFEQSWSIVSEDELEAGWRIGGRQILDIHRGSRRLFTLMHEGPEDTHKQDGTEVWVFDLETRKRLQRIPMQSPGFTFMGFPLEFGQDWPWPFSGLYGWIVNNTASAIGIAAIQVTQDDDPRLVTSGPFSGSLGIYDALTGEFLDRVTVGNMSNLFIQIPPWPLDPARHAK